MGILKVLTGDCGFSYVLSSFVQNDPIEHHFGLYRQMSGSNYNVSVCQVLESERTLKLSNILKLYKRQTIIRRDRASFKKFLNTFLIDKLTPTECSETHDLTIYLSIITMDTVDPDLETQQALAFIAGYAAFSAMKKLSKTSELCLDCTSFLCEDKCLDVEEIQPSFQIVVG